MEESKSDKIFGNTNSSTVQNLINEALPENAWLVDENIKFINHLNDYNSIIDDLEFAKDCLSELSKINPDVKKSRLMKRAFFTNSIITYTRCFNHTKKDGRISINHKNFKKEFPDNVEITANDLIKFHNYIMELRNTFVAHADKNIFETSKTYVQFNYDGEFLNSTFANLSVSMFSFDKTQLKNFEVLINYLIILLKKKSQLLTEKVKNEIGNEKLLEIGLNTLKKTKANNVYNK